MKGKKFTTMKNKKGYLNPFQVEQLAKYHANRAIEYSNEYDKANKEQEKFKYYKLYRLYKMNFILIHVIFRTGRRISEIIGQRPYDRLPGLRLVDIDFEAKTIKWYIAKKMQVHRSQFERSEGGQKRPERIIDEMIIKAKSAKQGYEEELPVDDRTLSLIKKYTTQFNIPRSARIFSRYDGIPLNRMYIDRMIKEAAKAEGVVVSGSRMVKERLKKDQKRLGIQPQVVEKPYKIGIHMLRHSYSMNFLNKNKDDPTALPNLQKMLVHSNLSVTSHYLSANMEDLRKMQEKAFDSKPLNNNSVVESDNNDK